MPEQTIEMNRSAGRIVQQFTYQFRPWVFTSQRVVGGSIGRVLIAPNYLGKS